MGCGLYPVTRRCPRDQNEDAFRLISSKVGDRQRYRAQRNRQRSSGFLWLGRAPFIHSPLYKVMYGKLPNKGPRFGVGRTLVGQAY